MHVFDGKQDGTARLAANAVLARQLQYHVLGQRKNRTGEIARAFIGGPLSHVTAPVGGEASAGGVIGRLNFGAAAEIAFAARR